MSAEKIGLLEELVAEQGKQIEVLVKEIASLKSKGAVSTTFDKSDRPQRIDPKSIKVKVGKSTYRAKLVRFKVPTKDGLVEVNLSELKGKDLEAAVKDYPHAFDEQTED